MLLHPQLVSPGDQPTAAAVAHAAHAGAYYAPPHHYAAAVDMSGVMPMYAGPGYMPVKGVPVPMDQRMLFDYYQQHLLAAAAMYANGGAQWMQQPPPNMLSEAGLTGEEDVDLTCVDCNQKFYFSASEQQFFIQRGYRVPLRCRACRNVANQARALRNQPAVLEEGDTLIGPCRGCNQQFIFTAGEKEFFAERGFQEPVRCRNCRRMRRNHSSNNSTGSPASVISPATSTLNLDKIPSEDKETSDAAAATATTAAAASVDATDATTTTTTTTTTTEAPADTAAPES